MTDRGLHNSCWWKDQKRKDNTLRAWNAICRADGVERNQLLEALFEPYVGRRTGEDDDDKGEGGRGLGCSSQIHTSGCIFID